MRYISRTSEPWSRSCASVPRISSFSYRRSPAIPATGSARMARFTIKRMVRMRGGRTRSSTGADLVAEAVHGFDRLAAHRRELLPEPPDVTVDGPPRHDVVVGVPLF